MRLYVVAIWDSALDAFNNPIFVPHIGVATRSFGDEVNNPSSPMNGHPTDYELHCLGDFDPDSGAFGVDGRRLLVRGADVYRSRESS